MAARRGARESPYSGAQFMVSHGRPPSWATTEKNDPMRIKNQADFAAGLLFAGAGAAFAIGATRLHVGDALDFGPGYLPLLLGGLLFLLGAVVMFQSLAVERLEVEAAPRRDWKALVFVVLAILAFGLLLDGQPAIGLPSMGLVAAILATTLIASLAATPFKPGQALLLAVGLALLGYLVLVWALRLPISAWPAFAAG